MGSLVCFEELEVRGGKITRICYLFQYCRHTWLNLFMMSQMLRESREMSWVMWPDRPGVPSYSVLLYVVLVFTRTAPLHYFGPSPTLTQSHTIILCSNSKAHIFFMTHLLLYSYVVPFVLYLVYWNIFVALLPVLFLRLEVPNKYVCPWNTFLLEVSTYS